MQTPTLDKILIKDYSPQVKGGKREDKFAPILVAYVCHPIETISADGLQCVHGRQLCWSHQRAADYSSTITPQFHNNHTITTAALSG